MRKPLNYTITCFRSFRVAQTRSTPPRRCLHHPASQRVFQEGDIIILRHKHDPAADGILTKLRSHKKTHTHRGVVPHASIIGKQLRDVVRTAKGHEYRIHEPTLAEYVKFTPRIVTPIYPTDANLILSLLDIHVSPPPSTSIDPSPPLEILEAGTGHGALTLHLSRAIHAANPAAPVAPTISLPSPEGEGEGEDAVYLGESLTDLHHAELEAWKARRGAVVHTLDISAEHSTHARKTIQGFRRGIYAHNIDFHVGDLSAWISSQFVHRKSSDPFLAYVLLDLPNANHHLANVAKALHVDGMLTVFNPSITQIVDCVEHIRSQKLPYLLDQVVELGASGTIRQWDVRAVRPRSTLKKETSSVDSGSASEVEGSGISAEVKVAGGDQVERDEEQIQSMDDKAPEWTMICRPKVGERVVGGGFVGIWRRMRPRAGLEM